MTENPNALTLADFVRYLELETRDYDTLTLDECAAHTRIHGAVQVELIRQNSELPQRAHGFSERARRSHCP